MFGQEKSVAVLLVPRVFRDIGLLRENIHSKCRTSIAVIKGVSGKRRAWHSAICPPLPGLLTGSFGSQKGLRVAGGPALV